jgi:hypothetical protein
LLNIYGPPALIFPCKNWENELNHNAPLGTLGIAHESGLMTGTMFFQWLKHFLSFVKPIQENKVLLIVDRHSSHKHVDVLYFTKENVIVMLRSPPYGTH